MIVIGAVIHPDFSGGAERGYYNIQLAVAIQIANGRATMTRWCQRSESSFRCQSRKFHSARIVENRVRLLNRQARLRLHSLYMAAGNENVLPAIVIKVGDVGRVSR